MSVSGNVISVKEENLTEALDYLLTRARDKCPKILSIAIGASAWVVFDSELSEVLTEKEMNEFYDFD